MSTIEAYLREAEAVLGNHRITDEDRRHRLAAIRREVETLGGDPKLVPSAEGPPAERRATRESKRAATRRKG